MVAKTGQARVKTQTSLNGNPAKPKQTKSRNGCKTCKQRRTKCDETKPICMKCAERNIPCGGYAPNFKWVGSDFPANTPRVTPSTYLEKQELIDSALESAALSVVGKSLRELEQKEDQGPSVKRLRRSWSLSDVESARPRMKLATRASVGAYPNARLENSSTIFEIEEGDSCNVNGEPDSLKSETSVLNVSTAETSTSPVEDQLPRDPVADLNLTPSLSALINQIFTPSAGKKGLVTLDELTALSPFELSDTVGLEFLLSQKELDTFLSLKQKTAEQKNPLGQSVFEQSLLQTSEHDQILGLYSSHTSGILSIKCGQNENPWNLLYVPLAKEYSIVFNSIASMTLFHLAGNCESDSERGNMRSKGYLYMKKCILELAAGLKSVEEEADDSSLPLDVALVTCLNLAISESWDTHTSSGIAHLKGAKSLIHRVMSLIKEYMSKRRQQLPRNADAQLRGRLKLVNEHEWNQIDEGALKTEATLLPDFLVPRNLQLVFNKWIYLHVLSQMTVQSGQDEKGIDLVATITSVIHKSQKQKIKKERTQKTWNQKEPSSSPESELNGSNFSVDFFESFNYSFQNNDLIDPLLGCAQSLFLIMGSVASLISLVRKEKERSPKNPRNSLQNIGKASELRQRLLAWKPDVSSDGCSLASGGESWDLHSCITTAEAYRIATLLYLYQAFPEIPLVPSHQLAEKIFILLATVPSTSNLHIVHIFPLLVSSCEATSGEEREWCESRWAFLAKKLWIGNIDRAFEVVKEVWRRKDEHMRKKRRGLEDSTISVLRVIELDTIVSEINGRMAAQLETKDEDGICSPLHWNSVMKEWKWEVFLG